MIALIQRVTHAKVEIGEKIAGTIDQGVLALIGVVRADTPANAERLLQHLLGYRIFPDAQGKMNLSLSEIQGGLLLVPQFTLAADSKKGMRPSFTPAALPEQGRALFEQLLRLARERHQPVASGVFGADMQVSLCNDGPVTFWLEG
ncbi:MAG: D-aminoacyl-tRNA deacylase [Gammaproteobacteria bacterium SHHR-1]